MSSLEIKIIQFYYFLQLFLHAKGLFIKKNNSNNKKLKHINYNRATKCKWGETIKFFQIYCDFFFVSLSKYKKLRIICEPEHLCMLDYDIFINSRIGCRIRLKWLRTLCCYNIFNCCTIDMILKCSDLVIVFVVVVVF